MTAATMTVDEAAQKAIAMIEAHDYLSFAELGRAIPGFDDDGHDPALIGVGDDVLWAVSPFGAEVFGKIEPLVAFHPSTSHVYLTDGARLRLDPPYRFVPMTLRPRRSADYVTSGGLVTSIGDKTDLWATLTRKIGKAAVAEGKRRAHELVAKMEPTE